MSAVAPDVHDFIDRGLDVLGEGLAIGIRPVVPRLAAYLELLEDWNTRINLVSRKTSRDELVTRHLLESLEGVAHLPPPGQTTRVLVDIGSGGGFPAVPLLIARPDLRGVLVEATGKKCAFLRAAIEALELTAQVVNARFPACFPMESPGEVAVVTSRAVAGVWPEVRRAPGLWARRTRGLFWTTESAWPGADEPLCKTTFKSSRLGERRGIAVVECST